MRRLFEVKENLAALYRAGVIAPVDINTLGRVAMQAVRKGLQTDLAYTLNARRTPDKPAIISGDRVITWAGFIDRIGRLAGYFSALGIGPHEAVAICLPNAVEFIEAQTAATAVGAAACFINPRTPAGAVSELVSRTGAKLTVTDRADLDGPGILRTGAGYEGALRKNLSRPGHSGPGKVVVFTSGTTGKPKGAIRDLGKAGLSWFGLLRVIPLRRNDTHLVVCPLYHSAGLGFATAALALGNTVVLCDKFSPGNFAGLVSEHRVTSTVVVPSMLSRITEGNFSSLRVVVCTGSRLGKDARDRARHVFGEIVYDLYGSTEIGWVSIASPKDQIYKPASVGRIVPGVNVQIRDVSGRTLRPGVTGEIWAASRVGMDGYVGDEDLTASRMKDGYISVRDLGFVDPEGYLHVVDRADDMIISGGVNVYPAETEIALAAHPNVIESAAMGIPDERWGQRVVAAVVVSSEISGDEIIAWCKAHTQHASVPKEIRFVDSLPRNDIGKVDKRILAALWET